MSSFRVAASKTSFLSSAIASYPIAATKVDDVPDRDAKVIVLRPSSTWTSVIEEPKSHAGFLVESVVPAFNRTPGEEVVSHSAPMEIWEGTVLSLDQQTEQMHVELVAKMGSMPRHFADIEMQWVPEQDLDLIREGAVFYLTLFRRMNPSIENAQELRFRRRPSWSKQQLKTLDAEAEMLASKMRPVRFESD